MQYTAAEMISLHAFHERFLRIGGTLEKTLNISAAGIDFYAQQIGEARQINEKPHAVFLHGTGDDLHTWDSVWAVLGKNLSALRYDLRGFGLSFDNSEAAFNHADDLLAILNAVNIEKCDLIGVSMGGAVALNFTLDHPDRVRNLILISPGMVAWEWSDMWKALWEPIVDKARADAMSDARNLWWQHPLFAATRASAAAQHLFESIMRYSGSHWLCDHHELMMPDVERLHTLKTRTLLLTGGRDLDDFRLIADLIEANAADLKRIDWPECGHLLHLENPEKCAREILEFLNWTASV